MLTSRIYIREIKGLENKGSGIGLFAVVNRLCNIF